MLHGARCLTCRRCTRPAPDRAWCVQCAYILFAIDVPVLSKGFGPTPALAPGRIPDSEPAALCTWSRVDGKVVPFDCGLVVVGKVVAAQFQPNGVLSAPVHAVHLRTTAACAAKRMGKHERT